MEARNQQCLVNFIDSPNSVLHIGCVQKISSCIYTKLKCQPPAQLVCMVDIYCTDICSIIFIKIQFEVLSIDSNVYKVTPYLQHGSWITWFFLSFEFQTIPKFTKNGCLLLNIQRKTPSTGFFASYSNSLETLYGICKQKILFYLGFRQSEQTCIDASIKAWGYCISTQVNHPLLGMHSAPRNRMCVSNVISVVLGEL